LLWGSGEHWLADSCKYRKLGFRTLRDPISKGEEMRTHYLVLLALLLISACGKNVSGQSAGSEACQAQKAKLEADWNGPPDRQTDLTYTFVDIETVVYTFHPDQDGCPFTYSVQDDGTDPTADGIDPTV
jgi:hypothetical protein